MDQSILFSIIIPVYNVDSYLNQCVDSILCQTYSYFEIILIDDGSTDHSPMICDKYSQLDSRIQVYHIINEGLSHARNFGLSRSKGDYVIFLDSDDFWVDTKALYKFFEIIITKHCDFIGFNCAYYHNGKYSKWPQYNKDIINSISKNQIIKELVCSGIFPMSACLKVINKKLLTSNHLSFKYGITAEDIPWFISLLEISDNIVFINEYVYAYRQGVETSITSTFSELKYNNLLNIIEEEIDNLSVRIFSVDVRQYLMSFFAYEFSILLGFYYKLSKAERLKYDFRLNKLLYLFEYDAHPKVRRIVLLSRILGLRFVSRLLYIYLYLR